MKKYYKVNLYKIDESENNSRLKCIEQIIVEHSDESLPPKPSREIITGLRISDYHSHELLDEGKNVKKCYIKNDILRNFGFQLFILWDELVQKNRVTIDELMEYNDNFPKSKFKEIYDGMKVQDRKTEREIHRFVKKIRNRYISKGDVNDKHRKG